ncbi:metallo-beta-lactamase family protein-like protein [Angomonas deanei]|nr:metallo-beta-lactamase family protein-like protein [Angomonas deanei]EPY43894.1 metallo-beta-lactamase family protein-like protein [Angomonas deanei]|eukprot:EPY39992.1 metallo-beta-lactamase family protein-like protein [Angomonas deanei]
MEAGMGIPRIPRLQVRPISILHETTKVSVAGRNFCNGFRSNQYLIINKENKQCIFVDASDDWPDDWVAFISASGLTPTHIFLTHCHIDNVINLNALMHITEQHFKIRLGVMWSPTEQVWVEKFPAVCERYGRLEERRLTLPLLQNSQYSYYTYHSHLLEKQRLMEEAYRSSYQTDEEGEASLLPDRPPPPQVVRREDILLSSATNRATSFYEFGKHCALQYIFTPGHSPGHMMLSLPQERLLFTGDVLYYNGIGRVDLPWATGEQLAESLLLLESHSDRTVLLPGHGRLTTLGRERRQNPALRSLYERRELGQQTPSVGFNDGYM